MANDIRVIIDQLEMFMHKNGESEFLDLLHKLLLQKSGIIENDEKIYETVDVKTVDIIVLELQNLIAETQVEERVCLEKILNILQEIQAEKIGDIEENGLVNENLFLKKTIETQKKAHFAELVEADEERDRFIDASAEQAIEISRLQRNLKGKREELAQSNAQVTKLQADFKENNDLKEQNLFLTKRVSELQKELMEVYSSNPARVTEIVIQKRKKENLTVLSSRKKIKLEEKSATEKRLNANGIISPNTFVSRKDTYFSVEMKKENGKTDNSRVAKPVNVTLLTSSPMVSAPVDVAESQQVQKLEPKNEAAELLAKLIEIYKSLINREQEAIPVFNNTIKMIGNKISEKMDCYSKDYIELVQAYPSLVHRFSAGSYICSSQAVDLLLGNFSESLATNAAKFPQALYTLAYVLNDLAKADKSIENAIKKSLDKGKGSHDFANKLKTAVKPLLEKQVKKDIDSNIEKALAIFTTFIDSGREICGIYKKNKLNKSLDGTSLGETDTNVFLQSLGYASVERMNQLKESESIKIKKPSFFSRFFSKNKVDQVKQSEIAEPVLQTDPTDSPKKLTTP